MPCTNDEAQLPTPTIATRTSSRCRSSPFAEPFFAPFVALIWESLLVGLAGVGGVWRGSVIWYPRGGARLRSGRFFFRQCLADMPDPLAGGEERQAGEHVDGHSQELDVEDAGSLREHET